MTEGRAASGDWFAAVTAGSETGALAAGVDWAATPLGPPDEWPPSLRMAAGLCLVSRFPMLVLWGPDLIQIYNDGYRPILGTEKHPAAMGAPAIETWPEIWPVIGPMFDAVLSTGEPTWHENDVLVIDRNGHPEECFFTWSYGPIVDESGRVGGVLDIVTETTAQVVGARRLACLGDLRDAFAGAEDVPDVCTRAIAVLRRYPADVASADLYLDSGSGPTLMASTRRQGIVGAIDPRPLARVARRGTAERIGDLYLMPVGNGVLAVGLNEARPFDDGYRSFLVLLGDVADSTIADAFRRGAEVDDLRRVNEALQHAMLPPPPELAEVAVRYLPAVGNLAVGGDWYDMVELPDGGVALLVGDCVGHGLEAAARMGQLRSATRALLLDGLGPADVLEGLDRFAASIDGAECTTVFCGIIETETGTFVYSSAGHPPPLLLRAGEVAWVDGLRDLPLAVDASMGRTEGKLDLRPGDHLVLYTDGLVERRGESLEDGFARLVEVASELGGLEAAEVADGLMRGLLSGDGDGDDDVALLVHRCAPD